MPNHNLTLNNTLSNNCQEIWSQTKSPKNSDFLRISKNLSLRISPNIFLKTEKGLKANCFSLNFSKMIVGNHKWDYPVIWKTIVLILKNSQALIQESTEDLNRMVDNLTLEKIHISIGMVFSFTTGRKRGRRCKMTFSVTLKPNH